MDRSEVTPDAASTGSRSPCVRNCCLDEGDVCLGCGRTLQEIVGWNQLSDAEKDEVLARAAERRKARSWW
ncbi:MAG: DUF1289 domain-containing protein [Ketobacteraceae bacterium]|nr:DUF1289 domain-containing protein [Ketobacteraceae bacterium]